MNSFFTIILIGISLSMDAFSLSLIYRMSKITKSQKIFLSLIVGIYHFFMPLIGLQFGNIINNLNIISLDLIASLILAYIGFDLIRSNYKNEELTVSKIGFLMFGLSVSIDSLSVGIGLKAITNNYYLSSIVFSLSSLTFTYLGLILGNIIGNKVGDYSKTLGGIILIIIAILLYFN